ncbi:MAG: alpha,alpha-trehalose-phosphate synthase (UDP-forming) [Sporichthyaceae bacterium]
MATAAPEVLVASNRGPLSFHVGPDGSLLWRRGAGGLVAALATAGVAEQVSWVCAAISDADRSAALAAPGGRLDLAGHEVPGRVRMLPLDPTVFARAYNGIANSVLWFVHHLLFDVATHPEFDHAFARDWQDYHLYNTAFAEALAADAAPGARVLIQDYHLTLAPAILRKLRPDLRIAHFSHTPWAPTDYYRMLPDDVGAEVLRGILGADHAAFLTRRWASAFLDCCEAVLDAEVDRSALTVTHLGRTTRIGVHALGVDSVALTERADRPDVAAHAAALTRQVGDRALIVRVDRSELSKNITRGLHAYRELLRRHPEWHDRVVHLVIAYPSRHDLPEYREYSAAVQRIAREIDDEFGTEAWQPVILHVDDDHPRSLAAYTLADVMVVNPLRDGMNLVAKEAPVVSRRDCALVLSREAGAVDELGAAAVTVNPYDVSGTAAAMNTALLLSLEDRATRCTALVAAASACPPAKWFLDQLRALDAVETAE